MNGCNHQLTLVKHACACQGKPSNLAATYCRSVSLQSWVASDHKHDTQVYRFSLDMAKTMHSNTCVLPAAATLTAQYNNLDSVREVFAANKGEIAGVILEPVVGNSGYIAPTKDFLKVTVQAALFPMLCYD